MVRRGVVVEGEMVFVEMLTLSHQTMSMGHLKKHMGGPGCTPNGARHAVGVFWAHFDHF